MKFGQLIEYNMRMVFLEKSFTKCGGEASPTLKSQNQNCAHLWINRVKCYKSLFLVCVFFSVFSLPLLLEILGNICIVIICCQVCDAINFESNQSFLIKLLLYITKKSGQNCKYIKTKRAFSMK